MAPGFDWVAAVRFLAARCPEIVESPEYLALLQQVGLKHSLDIVTQVLQGLLLQPETASAVALGFRPVLANLVSAAVDRILSGRLTVRNPAAAAVALVDVLSLAPYLQRELLQGIAHIVPPIESLIQLQSLPTSRQDVSATQLAFAALRLLKAAPDASSLRMLSGIENLLQAKETTVRWAAVECVALLYKLTGAAKQSLGDRLVGSEAALSCALKWRDDCARVAIHRAAVWMPSPSHFGSKRRRLTEGLDDDAAMPDAPHSEGNSAAPPGFADVCGVLLPARDPRKIQQSEANQRRLVVTPTVKRNLGAAALALCQGRPLLLEGPPGSGKSALIDELAQVTGNTDYITVLIDDQMDSKTLLGAYIATATPGEFTWQPGLLTQAVMQGRWLVIEDVNLAPPDVLAALVPLLDSKELHLSQRAQTIRAAPGFQLLATVTCSPGGGAVGAYGDSQGIRNMLGGLWTSVTVEPPTLPEQVDILSHAFPGLQQAVIAGCMAVLHLCQQAGGHGSMVHDPGGLSQDWDVCVQEALAAADVQSGEFATLFGHHFSLRDLFKLCQRLQSLHDATVASRRDLTNITAIPKLPHAYREAAFQECADCFTAMIANSEARRRLLLAVASIWGLPADTVERHTWLSKPGIQVTTAELRIGRAMLAKTVTERAIGRNGSASFQKERTFAHTAHVMRTMEAVTVAISQREATLLVGETGTGKSTLVQHIADQVGVRLVALNLSQQTDSSDLLGGFRPVQATEALSPLLERFYQLVSITWTKGDNAAFLARVSKLSQRRKWSSLLQAFKAALAKVEELDQQQKPETPGQSEQGGPAAEPLTTPATSTPRKRKTLLSTTLRSRWQRFSSDVVAAEKVVDAAEGGVAFAFIEGALVKAVQEGSWLLLDEINLAPPEALERIAGLLECSTSSIVLSEQGDSVAVPRHPNFRLLAAMNPATDAGKRDLPPQLRQRFTELYVPEMTGREDLQQVVLSYLNPASVNPPANAVVDFYLAARADAETVLQDSAGSKPSYSLRTLSRALEYARAALPTYGLQRALYDGAAMTFLTQLHPSSAPVIEALLQKHLLRSTKPSDIKAIMQRVPAQPLGGSHVLFEHFWVEAGSLPLPDPDATLPGGHFVVTPSVSMHLRNLARAVLLRRYPILLQGPTSSGKTTLVAQLAARTGHRCVRINNHEGTDLQEYLGSYITDEQGRLVFREGALVTALRQGQWIVLDELNLAPSEVLEALNRLLDDNRELYVPELQETVRPHPHFMLFATQNPAGAYGGRKTMSRAFRSRFLEVHVGDIPDTELATILHERCSIAPSHAGKLVAVMRELQRRRQGSNVFAGKHGLITPRDLFKWAGRGAVTYEQLAQNGYMLLAERLRAVDERCAVQSVLQSIMNVKLDMKALYAKGGSAPVQQLQQRLTKLGLAGSNSSKLEEEYAALQGIVWTPSMCRMYTLLDRCLETSEPALLVGETGTGKTTVCQLAAMMRGQRLHILNCNQHTEASDFLGGFRPSRNRQQAIISCQAALAGIQENPLLSQLGHPALEDPPTLSASDLRKTSSLAVSLLASARKAVSASQSSNALQGLLDQLEQQVELLMSSVAAASAPFEWMDGPLVTAMRLGDIILIDELNLAEDAVLERLNSVLEAGRTLTLAEKGGAGAEEITAAPGFRLVATMNPGGDYGKRELSPALANRFTTIWVPAFEDIEELGAILRSHIQDARVRDLIAPRLLEFWQFFHAKAGAAKSVLSVRDLLAWAGFINTSAPTIGAFAAYAHGAHLVLLDGIGLGIGMPLEAARALQDTCKAFLSSQLPGENQDDAAAAAGDLHSSRIAQEPSSGGRSISKWGIDPFWISSTPGPPSASRIAFDFQARTTACNAMRVLRALQLRKAVLLEGSPGVGKTSLVSAIAKATGRKLVRINLSEQTDMMDLLGADLPAASSSAGDFAWCDGPLLGALKAGHWVLLDELNLAGQSVLEGLNAMLDHRGEIFIAELRQTFRAPEGFQVFAAQNPLQEGGGRRGLPKSFLNRFTRVHINLLQPEDLVFISGALYPHMPQDLVQRMVLLLDDLHRQVNITHTFGGSGSPWEFNLRDLLRWCHLARTSTEAGADVEKAAQHFARMLLEQRLRTPADRLAVAGLLQARGFQLSAACKPTTVISATAIRIGWAQLDTKGSVVGIEAQFSRAEQALQLLNGQLGVMESVAHCIQQGWPVLLAGAHGTGKTSVVRTLALLCNKKLVEVNLTAGTDTSDILGGFEQLELARRVQEAAGQINSLVRAASASLLALPAGAGGNASKLSASIAALSDLTAAWSAYKKHPISREQGSLDWLRSLEAALGKAKAVLMRDAGGSPPAVVAEMDRSWTALASLHATFTSEVAGQAAGRFEWVDGALTRAIEQGHWVLLDNANLCNPTVLDRLNPLLEPEGSLLLNEAGTRDGEARVLRAHPDFRLFLALDPRHGEVSRAMRNRCIELCLQPDAGVYALAAAASTNNPRAVSEAAASQLEDDLHACLAAEGVPGSVLPQAMLAAHFAVGVHAAKMHKQGPTKRELHGWAALTRVLAEQGWNFEEALLVAWQQVYVRGRTSLELRCAAEGAFMSHCHGISAAVLATPSKPESEALQQALYRPSAWPFVLTLTDWQSNPAIATIARDASLMEGYLYNLLAADPAKQPRPAAVTREAQLAFGLSAPALHSALTANLAGQGSSILGSAERVTQEMLVIMAWHAAAAFAERVSQDDGRLRSIWITSLSDQLQLLQGSAASAARDISETVCKQLEHPLQACRSQHPNGAAQQLAMLWWVHAAARFMATACKAVAKQRGLPKNASLLQTSYWRSINPQAKARIRPAQPLADALFPLMEAVLGLQHSIPSQILEGGESGMQEATALVVKLQEIWTKLWHYSHGALGPVALQSTSDQVLQPLVFHHQRLVKVLRVAAAGSAPFQDSEAWQQLQEAIEVVNSSLGWDGIAPPAPLLWMEAGRPTLPGSTELFAAEVQLHALANLARTEIVGFRSDQVSWPEVLAAAGIKPPTATPEGSAWPDTEDLGQGIAASLAMHTQLRRDLVEGSCLFRLAAYRTFDGREPDMPKACKIVSLLQDRVQRLAAKLQVPKSGVPTLPDISLATLHSLPWQLMGSGRARELQSELLALQTAAVRTDSLAFLTNFTKATVAAQCKAAVGPVLKLLNWVESIVGSAVPHSAGGVRREVLLKQLQWLLTAPDVMQQPDAQFGKSPLEVHAAEILQGMWIDWLSSCCGCPPSVEEANAHSPPAPLHTSAVRRIVAGAMPSVEDYELRAMQLQLAARQLCRWSTAEGIQAASTVRHTEWASLQSLLAQIILAFRQTTPAPESIVACVSQLEAHDGVVGADVEHLLEKLRATNHQCLAGHVDQLLAPCLHEVLRASNISGQDQAQTFLTEAEDQKRMGRAWALLGVLRLHLLGPWANVDPALEPALERDSILIQVEGWLQPELEVRQELQRLPGGPDEGPRIAELKTQIASAQEIADKLKSHIVPRPSPSQYPALKQELARFKEGLASPQRVTALITGLQGESSASALEEATFWRQNAAAFISRLEASFAMYRDLVEPVKQAILETMHGLSLLASASASMQSTSHAVDLILQLAAFPQSQSITMERNRVQFLTKLAASLLTQRCKPDPSPSAKQVAFDAQLSVLRALLLRSLRQNVHELQKSKVAEEAQPLFEELLKAWEAIKEAEDAKLSEEAELFKTKTREHSFKTEEEQAEAEYKLLFPDHSEVFAAFASAPSEFEMMVDEPEKDAQSSRDAAESAAGQSLVRGQLLHDVVQIQRRMLAPTADHASKEEWKQDFEQGYDLGTRIAEECVSALPATAEQQVASAHLLRLALAHNQLKAPAAQGNASVDVQQPSAPEVGLMKEPVAALQQRLWQLLEDWPENPLLEQLVSVCQRLLGLSMQAPLKAAMTGVELLIDRSQLWEQSAAKHVSIAPQLEKLSALARRWRRMELSSWRSLLQRVLAQHAAGAERLWFYLFRLLLTSPATDAKALQQLATTLEAFLQSPSLGEYERRLDMLDTFRLHASAARHSKITVILQNVHSYYRQYLHHVQAAMSSGLAPVEKHLQDFVKLAKWEDRGHYAQKQETEKSQRQLHKMVRDAQAVLSRPVEGVLKAALAAVGFEDLSKPDLEDAKATTKSKGRKAAKKTANAPLELTSWQEQVPQLQSKWLQQCTAARQAIADSLRLAGHGIKPDATGSGPDLYQKRLPQLSVRLADILQPAAVGASTEGTVLQSVAGATSLDNFASQAAAQALELRNLSDKSSRARKKKSLVDFLRALGSVGVSHRRSAVRADQRSTHSWFAQAGPGDVLPSLLAEAETTNGFSGAAALWTKSDTYYHRSISRLQRLLEAAQQPHQDLSSQEAGRAVRLSEHLLFLQRQQRAALRTAAELHASLGSLVFQMAGFKAAIPGKEVEGYSQELEMATLQAQDLKLQRLAILLQDTMRLIDTAADAEVAVKVMTDFKSAANGLEIAHNQVLGLLASMQIHLPAHGIQPATASVVITPAALAACKHVQKELSALHQYLDKDSARFANSVPGWSGAVYAVASAVHSAPLNHQADWQGDTQAGQKSAKMEEAISSLLLWAQGARPADPPGTSQDGEEAEAVGELMTQLEAQIAPGRLCKLANAISSLLLELPMQGYSPREAQQLQQVRSLVSTARTALGGLTMQYLQLHKATAKLGYISTSIFAGLMQEGFCTAEQTEGDGEGAGAGMFKESEGTGMGEGEGAKDVSDQIESEDQLLGAKQKDAPEEDKELDAKPHEDEGAKGIEMEADFEGSLEDLPPNEEESDEEAAEGDDERLQQEMGEVGDAGETVDERMWGDEDKPEEGQQGPEKYEKEAPVQVEDTSKLEYQAGEEEPDSSARDKQQQKQLEEAKQDKQKTSDADAEQDEEGNEADQDLVNEDTEEKYEDRQFAAPQDPDTGLDLPEDMALDAEEAGADAEDVREEDSQEAAEQIRAFPEQPTPADTLPGGPDEAQDQDMAEPEQSALPEESGEERDMKEEGQSDRGEEELDSPEADAREEGLEPTGDLADEDGSGHADEAPEAGPSGYSAAAVGAAENEAKDRRGENTTDIEHQQIQAAAAEDQAPQDARQDQSGAASESRRGLPQPNASHAEGATELQQPRQRQEQTNPYRSLGNALERWRAQLNVTAEQEANTKEDEKAAALDDAGIEESQPPAAEYEFLADGEAYQQGDAQAMAPATEQQAASAELPDPNAAADADEGIPGAEEDETMPDAAAPLQDQADQVMKTGPQSRPGHMDEDLTLGKDRIGEDQPDVSGAQHQQDDTDTSRTNATDSFVASLHQRQTALEDKEMNDEGALRSIELSAEEAAAIRSQMDKALQQAAEGRLTDGDLEFGRQMWSRCEALTAGLAGELTEQLRLLLEPTKASRLAGDYRSGKRISIRKVVAYIASNFRKDKIWLRRTRPDKRQYQVVLAVDDSRSMRENSCGSFAMEAVTLIARALGRLEVGELSVVSFGGSGATLPLHPLDRPFTDADGPRVLSHLHFDQDNTIADRPVVELVTSLVHMLEGARHRMAAGSLAAPPLHQLVLIMSDGRFHEKESLRRAVAEASAKKGMLLAFIALDNPANSLLDMQSVSFVGGSPVFTKYLDSFPFPYYIVLQDIAALPRTLADLLRQWIQLSTT